jgi:hypothetical protein
LGYLPLLQGLGVGSRKSRAASAMTIAYELQEGTKP